MIALQRCDFVLQNHRTRNARPYRFSSINPNLPCDRIALARGDAL